MSDPLPLIVTEVERDIVRQTERVTFFVQMELDHELCRRLGALIRQGSCEHPMVKLAEAALIRAFYRVLEQS